MQSDWYFDESGNTGARLLDSDQPVFALAAVRCDAAVASELLAPIKGAAQEVKYSKVRSRPRGQKAILEALSSPLLDQVSVLLYPVDKRYYLASQLVDKIIEPAWYDRGHDLYARDGAINLARVWHYVGPHIFPGWRWDHVLSTFQDALRTRDATAFRAFEACLELCARDSPPRYAELLADLQACDGQLDQLLGIFPSSVSFDPAVDAFIALVTEAVSLQGYPIEVIHDESKPLRAQERLLRALTDQDQPVREVGYGARRMNLPLRVEHLSFADSTALPQLQLADLFAGVTVDCLLAWSGQRECTPFHDALKESRLGQMPMNGILPSPNIEASAPPALGDINPVDGAAAFLLDAGWRPLAR
ncbi:MAG: DUF3800 domain-containing protein [Burkholderiales bacterium]|nr:MAG: DUF3800 domain-containing protein [Burkholderiales bacterium]